jgi:DNA-binding CsgD family transcriptional regulator
VNSAKDNDNIGKEVAITAMQKEVLVLLCNQYSTNEIVEKLNIARNTVNRHRQELLDRTQAKNLAGLVIYALKHKIIQL